MIPMLGDATTPSWQSTLSVAAFFGTGLIGLGSLYFMKRQSESLAEQTRLLREQADRPQQIAPQPLKIEVAEELHEKFANKEIFETHVNQNTKRHAELFAQIDKVERAARKELLDAISGINTDRARTMEKLNEQFTFIRESISEMRTDIKHLNEK